MKSFFSRRTDRDSQTPIHKPSSRDTYKFWNTTKPEQSKQQTQNGDVPAVNTLRPHESKPSRSAVKLPSKLPYDPPPSLRISDRNKDKPSSNTHRTSTAAYPVYFPQQLSTQLPPKPPPSRTTELAHEKHQRPTPPTPAPAPPQPLTAQESRDVSQKTSRLHQHRPDHASMNPHEMWHPPPYASSSRPTETVPRERMPQQPHRPSEDKDRGQELSRRDRHRDRERGRDSDQETVKPREDYQRVRDADKIHDKGRVHREVERIERAKEFKRQQEELLRAQVKEQQRLERRAAEKEARRLRDKEVADRENRTKERPRVLSKPRPDRQNDIPSSDDNRHAPRDSRRPSMEQYRGTDSETERKRPPPSIAPPVEPEHTHTKVLSKDNDKRKESTGWISDSYTIRKPTKQVNKDPHLSDDGGNFSDTSLKRRLFPQIFQRKSAPEEKKAKHSRPAETDIKVVSKGNEVAPSDAGMLVYLPSNKQNPVENLPTPMDPASAESGNETDKTRDPNIRVKLASRGDEIPLKPPDIPQNQHFEPPRRPPSRGAIAHYGQYQVAMNQPQVKQNTPAGDEVHRSKRPDKTPRISPIAIEPVERVRPPVDLDEHRTGPVFPLSAPPDDVESGNERNRRRTHREQPTDTFAQTRTGMNNRTSQAPAAPYSVSKSDLPPSVRPPMRELPPTSAPPVLLEQPPIAEPPEYHRRMSIAQPTPIHAPVSDPVNVPDINGHQVANRQEHKVPPPHFTAEHPYSSSRRNVPEPIDQQVSNGAAITRPSTAMGVKESRGQPRSGPHHQSSQSADVTRRGPSAIAPAPSRVTSIYGHRNYGQENASTRNSAYPQEPIAHGDVMVRLHEARSQQRHGMSIARPSTTTGQRPDNYKSGRHHTESQTKHSAPPIATVASAPQPPDAAPPQSTARIEPSSTAAHQQAKPHHHPPPTPRVTTSTTLPPSYQDPFPKQSSTRLEPHVAPSPPDDPQPTRTHYQPPATPRVTTVLPPLLPPAQEPRPIAARNEAPLQPVTHPSRPSYHPPPTPRVGTIAPPLQPEPIVPRQPVRIEFPTFTLNTQPRAQRNVPPTPRVENRRLDPPPPSFPEQRVHHRRETSYPDELPKLPVDVPPSDSIPTADNQHRSQKDLEAQQPNPDKTNRLHSIPLPSFEEIPNAAGTESRIIDPGPPQQRSGAAPQLIVSQSTRPAQQLKRESLPVNVNKESPVGLTFTNANVVESNSTPARISTQRDYPRANDNVQPLIEDIRVPAKELTRPSKAMDEKEYEEVRTSMPPFVFPVLQQHNEPPRDSHKDPTRQSDDPRAHRKSERPRDEHTGRTKPPSPRQAPYPTPPLEAEPPVQATPRAPPLKLSHSTHTTQPLESKDLNQPIVPRASKNVDQKPSPTTVQSPIKIDNMVQDFRMPPIVRPPPIVPSTPLHVAREMPPIVRAPMVPSTPMYAPREIPPTTRGPVVPSTPLHVPREMPPIVKVPAIPNTPLHFPRDMPPVASFPYSRGKEHMSGAAGPDLYARERFNSMSMSESVIKPLDIHLSNTASFWAETPRADQAPQARLSTIAGPPTPQVLYRQSLQPITNPAEALADHRQLTTAWHTSDEPTRAFDQQKDSDRAPAIAPSQPEAYVYTADVVQHANQSIAPAQVVYIRGLEASSKHLPSQTPKQVNVDLPPPVDVLPDHKVVNAQGPADGWDRRVDNKVPTTTFTAVDNPPRSRKVSFENPAWEQHPRPVHIPEPIEVRHTSQHHIPSKELEVRSRKNSTSPRKAPTNIQGYTQHSTSKAHPPHDDEIRDDPKPRHIADNRRTDDHDRRPNANQATSRGDNGRQDSDQEGRRPSKYEMPSSSGNPERRMENNELNGVASPRAHKIQHPGLAEVLFSPQVKAPSHLREQPTPAPQTRILAPPEKHSPKIRTSPPERHRTMPEPTARTSPPKRPMEVSEKPSKESNRDSPKSRDGPPRQHQDPPAGPSAPPPHNYTVPMTPLTNTAPLTSEHPSRTSQYVRYPPEPTFPRDRAHRQSVIAARDYTDNLNSRNLVINPSNVPVEPAPRTAPLPRPVYPPTSRHNHSSSLPVNPAPPVVPEPIVTERSANAVPPAPVIQHSSSAHKEHEVRNSTYEPSLRREPSEDTILLQTPSSLAPSLALKPSVSKQSVTPSTASQKAKRGLFNMFRRPGQVVSAPAPEANQYENWNPVSSQTPDSSPSHDKPAGRGNAAPTPYIAPVPIPIRAPVAPEHKSASSKVFTPFRYLTMGSKRHHALSDISLEAQDGTPANTEIGSPNMSILSHIPIQVPPVQDAMVAAKDWVVKEADMQIYAKNRLGRYKPGIVFDAKEDPPEDQKKMGRMGRPVPRRSSRKEREAEKNSPPHEPRTVTITNDHHESRGDNNHHREH